MDVREKLVELVDKARRYAANKCHSFMSCAECDHYGEYDGNCRNTYIAESLIANGVTVQEWISVKDERKPKQLQECLCVCQFDDDAKGEWRFYNVLKWHDVPYQDNGIVNRPHFTDEGVHGMVVTHWMPLPKLPQPPKGE